MYFRRSSDDSSALRFISFLVKVVRNTENQSPPEDLSDDGNDKVSSGAPTERGSHIECEDGRGNTAHEGGDQAEDSSEETTVRDQAAWQCHNPATAAAAIDEKRDQPDDWISFTFLLGSYTAHHEGKSERQSTCVQFKHFL